MAFKLRRKNAYTRNWKLKLLALLLAVLTYYAIRSATGSVLNFDISLKVELEPGIAVMEQDIELVTVCFRGTQDDLSRLDQKRISAVVRPKGGDPNGLPRKVPITSRDIRGFSRVTIVDIDPDFVTLTFDREIEAEFIVAKPLVVVVPLIGKAKIDYSPKSVMVHGPKRLLEKLIKEGRNEVSTEVIDVEARVGNFTKRVKILPPGDTWLLGIDPNEVNVKVNIVRTSEKREWKGIKVFAMRDTDDNKSILIEPASVDISVEGKMELIKNLTKTEIHLFVDCIGLDPAGSYEFPVQANLPLKENVRVNINPKYVKVIFSEVLSQ